MEPTRLPAWFRDGTTIPRRWVHNVLAGRHPFGFALGAESQTCGDCRNRYHVSCGPRSFAKCLKHGRTSGKATDCQARWRACIYFQPKETHQ